MKKGMLLAQGLLCGPLGGVTDMGSGVTLRCPGCHYELEVILGVGFAYYSLENVIGRVHPRRRALMLEILRKHRVEHTTYQHALYHCGGCGGLYNRFYVKIEYDQGKVYETVFRCPNCKRTLTEVPAHVDLTTVRCPSCKENNLEIIGGCMWD